MKAHHVIFANILSIVQDWRTCFDFILSFRDKTTRVERLSPGLQLWRPQHHEVFPIGVFNLCERGIDSARPWPGDGERTQKGSALVKGNVSQSSPWPLPSGLRYHGEVHCLAAREAEIIVRCASGELVWRHHDSVSAYVMQRHRGNAAIPGPGYRIVPFLTQNPVSPDSFISPLG